MCVSLYAYVCVCVFVCVRVSMLVCVCVCAWVGVYFFLHGPLILTLAYDSLTCGFVMFDVVLYIRTRFSFLFSLFSFLFSLFSFRVFVWYSTAVMCSSALSDSCVIDKFMEVESRTIELVYVFVFPLYNSILIYTIMYDRECTPSNFTLITLLIYYIQHPIYSTTTRGRVG